jgi:hypothetical protein
MLTSAPERRQHRRAQRTLDRPTDSQPLRNRPRLETEGLVPFAMGSLNSAPRHEWRVASVASLFGSRSPTNVSGLIVPVVVDSIERVLRRRCATHVTKERLKALSPRGPDADASTSVVFVGPLVPVFATSSHCFPELVLLRPLTRRGLSMSSHSLAQHLLLEASTRVGLAVSKVAGTNHLGGPAVADDAHAMAPNASVSERVRDSVGGNRTTETPANKVFQHPAKVIIDSRSATP